MKALIVLWVVWSSGCIKIVHDHDCDGGGVVVGMPGEPAHAQALYVVNLQRSAANLTATYSGFIDRLNASLAASGVTVDEYAVLPLYGAVTSEPGLVYGEPASGAGDRSQALSAAALSGHFDAPLGGVTAEQYNVATLAKQLDKATLPPELTMGESRPFFSPPKDLFLIVTLQPAKRICASADAACEIDGVSPVERFTQTAPDGTAGWLKLPSGSYRPGRIFQAFVTTGEAESLSEFQTACKNAPGFPATLLDVLEPSPAKYYVDLASRLSALGWPAEQQDLCKIVSAAGPQLGRDLAAHIAHSLQNQ